MYYFTSHVSITMLCFCTVKMCLYNTLRDISHHHNAAFGEMLKIVFVYGGISSRMRFTLTPKPKRAPPKQQWRLSRWPSLSSAIIRNFVRSFSPQLDRRARLSGLARTAAWRRWPSPEPCAPPRRSTTFSRTRDRCRAKASRKRRASSCESVS